MGEMSVKKSGDDSNKVEFQRVEIVKRDNSNDNGSNVTATTNNLRFETGAHEINFQAQTARFRLNENFDLQVQQVSFQAQPQTQQAAVDAAAARVWEAADGDPAAAAALLDNEIRLLNRDYGREAGGALIAKLHQDSQTDNRHGELSNILTFAGANGSAADKSVIGRAVGQAYNSMSADERAAFTADLAAMTAANGFRGNLITNNGTDGSTALADIISRSGNDQLRQDTVAAMVKFATENVDEGWSLGPWDFNNGGVDINALYNSAAQIANSGSNSAAQTQMFGSITDSLTDLTDAQMRVLERNTDFKDAVSNLFINNSTEILHSLTDQNGFFDDNPKVDGFRRFMETTLFSSNPGSRREDLMGEMTRAMSNFADPNAPATAGRTKEADATLAGSLLALTQSAALFQQGDINASRESREEAVKFFTGMAFAFIPGASDALGEASGSLMDYAYDQAKDWATENADSTLSRFINDFNDGDALDNIKEGFEALRSLSFAIRSEVLGPHPSLARAFNDGYTAMGVDQLFQDAIEN
jgi:hypothetical protein